MLRQTTGRRSRRSSVLVGMLVFGLAVVLPLLRQRGHASWQTMWAEDGEVYYQQVRGGGLGTAFRGYDGYVQTVSRLMMLPARLVPLTRVPMYIAVASAVVAAILAALVYRWTEGFIASRTCRIALAAMHVLAPALGWEGTANIAWLINLLVPVVPWAIISRRRARFDTVTRSVVVGLAVLSHVLAAVFVPLALAIAWRRRTTADVIVAVSMCCALLVQLAFMAFASPRHASPPFAIVELLGLVAMNVLGSFLVGDAPLRSLWLDWGWAAPVLFLIVTTVLLAVLLATAQRSNRRRSLVWIGYAALTACIPFAVNGTQGHLVAGSALVPMQRYAFLPVLLLVGAVAMLVDPSDPSRRRAIARVGRTVLVLQLLVVVITSFRVTNLRSSGPLWYDQLHAAKVVCEQTSAKTARVDIAPDGWSVAVDCSDLGGI